MLEVLEMLMAEVAIIVREVLQRLLLVVVVVVRD